MGGCVSQGVGVADLVAVVVIGVGGLAAVEVGNSHKVAWITLRCLSIQRNRCEDRVTDLENSRFKTCPHGVVPR